MHDVWPSAAWAGIFYIHFQGLLPPNGILPGAKFTLRPSLAFSYFCSVTARHWSSWRQPTCGLVQRMELWNFPSSSFSTEGATYILRAAITLGIGLHRPNLVMTTLRSRCEHYIFILWFLLSFFPRLISVVGDWMSTILPHMVWP